MCDYPSETCWCFPLTIFNHFGWISSMFPRQFLIFTNNNLSILEQRANKQIFSYLMDHLFQRPSCTDRGPPVMSWDTEFPIPYQIRILARKQAGFSLQQLGRHPPCRRLILGLIYYTVLGSHFLYLFILLIRRKKHFHFLPSAKKKSCFKLKHLPLISKSTKRKHGI